MIDKKILEELRKKTPENVANEIISVQPISFNVIAQIYENSKPEDELIKEGYEPVSALKLLWRKK